MKFIVLTVVLIGFGSCGDPVAVESAADAVATDYVARPLGRMEFDGADVYQGDSESAKKARLELLGSVMHRFKRLRSTLRRVSFGELAPDHVASELITADLTQAERWFLEQMSATLILESMVGAVGEVTATPFPIAWDPQLAARCLSLLHDHKSPNAPLQARVLERLSTDWPEAEIAALAEAASNHALDWLERECGTCKDRLLPGGAEGQHMGIEVARMQQGIAALQRLAAAG